MRGSDERSGSLFSYVDLEARVRRDQAYLADILIRLANLWPNSRLDELLPPAWAKARQPNKRAA